MNEISTTDQTAWDAIAQWRDVLQTEASEHTARTYLHHVQVAVGDIARAAEEERDELPLSACTARTIRAHLARYQCQPDGRYHSPAGAPAERAPASVRLRLRALRAFSTWCVSVGLTSQDFTAGVRVRSEPAGGGGIRRSLTLEQSRTLLNQPSGARGSRDRLLVALSLTMGCSAGEIAGLSLGDVGAGESTLNLRGKGGKARQVSCPPVVQEALREWLRVRSRIAPAGERTLVLTRRGGLDAAGVSRALGRCLQRAGLEGAGWTSHVLRASCAQLALDSGASVREVQQLLGLESLTALRTLLGTSPASAAVDHPLARG